MKIKFFGLCVLFSILSVPVFPITEEAKNVVELYKKKNGFSSAKVNSGLLAKRFKIMAPGSNYYAFMDLETRKSFYVAKDDPNTRLIKVLKEWVDGRELTASESAILLDHIESSAKLANESKIRLAEKEELNKLIMVLAKKNVSSAIYSSIKSASEAKELLNKLSDGAEGKMATELKPISSSKSSLGAWLENRKKATSTSSPERAVIEEKSVFKLTNGEKLIGKVVSFKNGSYQVATVRGEIQISEKEISSIEKNSDSCVSNDCASEFHKKAAEVLLRLCSQCESGLSLISAAGIFSAAKADLDAVIRDYPSFPLLAKHYQNCFDLLRFPIVLHAESIEDCHQEANTFAFRQMLESSEWLVPDNQAAFKRLLPSLYEREFDRKYSCWYSHYTGKALTIVTLGVKAEMAFISKVM